MLKLDLESSLKDRLIMLYYFPLCLIDFLSFYFTLGKYKTKLYLNFEASDLEKNKIVKVYKQKSSIWQTGTKLDNLLSFLYLLDALISLCTLTLIYSTIQFKIFLFIERKYNN